MTQNDKTILVVAGGEQNTKPPISTLNLKSVEILDVISNETQWIEGKEKIPSIGGIEFSKEIYILNKGSIPNVKTKHPFKTRLCFVLRNNVQKNPT